MRKYRENKLLRNSSKSNSNYILGTKRIFRFIKNMGVKFPIEADRLPMRGYAF